MKIINGFLKFIGLNAFMAFVILLLLDYEDTSIVFLVVSVACFGTLLFLQLYKFYLVNNFKKNKTEDNE
jgi:hypothetical protein